MDTKPIVDFSKALIMAIGIVILIMGMITSLNSLKLWLHQPSKLEVLKIQISACGAHEGFGLDNDGTITWHSVNGTTTLEQLELCLGRII